MIKEGIITKFIQRVNKEKNYHPTKISQDQEKVLIAALQENFSKRINNNPKQFQRDTTGLNWDIFSEDVVSGLQKAGILIEDFETLQYRTRPFIYMNSCGEISVNHGHGCNFLHYPNPSFELNFFNARHYLQLLEDVFTKYFGNEFKFSSENSPPY
jgi:hypothetical protein